jgi:hypothetical protein
MKLIELLETKYNKTLSGYSDEQKIDYLKKYGTENIKYMEDPSDTVQMYAVTNNVNVIGDIKDPCEEAQMQAITHGGGSYIMKIENPTPKVQLAAVEHYPAIIKQIENPTKEAVMSALTNDSFVKSKLWGDEYTQFVDEYFKNNSILRNKWLRYRDNMRSML